MLILFRSLGPRLAKRFISKSPRLQVALELMRDVEAGETIVISERSQEGPKLRDEYPFVALGALMAIQPCHVTLHNPQDRYRIHQIDPEAFAPSGHDLPEDHELWRHQEFWKFKDLLTTETLYLSGLEHLEDPLEGSPTDSLREMIETVENPKGAPLLFRILLRIRSMYDLLQAFFKECCVSCWHMGPADSMDFWANCESARSVSIRTTVGAIIEAVEHEPNASTWKIHYLDYQASPEKADRVHSNKLEHLASHKDKRYSYEKEFRIVHFDPKTIGWRLSTRTRLDRPGRHCARIAVDLSKVVQEVRLHPDADPSFAKEVKDLMSEKLPNIEVVGSDLARP